jgi:hypothetical protein
MGCGKVCGDRGICVHIKANTIQSKINLILMFHVVFLSATDGTLMAAQSCDILEPEEKYVNYESSVKVSLKNGVFLDVTPCGSCNYRRSILVILIMEALSSSETSVPTRATRRNIPDDVILHSDRRENLKSYIVLTDWTL